MYPSITCSGAPTIPKQQDNGKRPPEHRSGGLFLRSVPAVPLPVLLLPQFKLPLQILLFLHGDAENGQPKEAGY